MTFAERIGAWIAALITGALALRFIASAAKAAIGI